MNKYYEGVIDEIVYSEVLRDGKIMKMQYCGSDSMLKHDRIINIDSTINTYYFAVIKDGFCVTNIFVKAWENGKNCWLDSFDNNDGTLTVHFKEMYGSMAKWYVDNVLNA